MLAAISCLLGSACDGNSNKDVSGAYELSFNDGTVRALLYLFRSPDDEYMAVLDGSECTVVRGEDTLILNGCSVLEPGRPNQLEQSGAVYVSFQLERDASGELATLSAFDQNSEARVDGQLERSRHAPVLRGRGAQPAPQSSVRPRLPWDAITLEFGDGVLIDEPTLAAAIDVDASGGDEVVPRWSYRSISVPESSRQLSLAATATINWPDLLGQRITFSLPAGTPDSVGKTMSNYMEVGFQLPKVAAPATAWELDDEAELAGFARWGNLAIVRDSAMCAGSCLQLGRLINACGEPGLAGQLDAHEASKLVVRVRTAMSKRLGFPLELGIYLGEAGVADGARSSTREPLAEKDQLQETDWRDIELPLSVAQRRQRLPFELRLIYSCPWSATTTAVPAPFAEATVLIDRIAVE
jgi:hypothetical protein